MLPDFERKLLRILVNFSGQRGRMPEVAELEVKTGKSWSQIRKALAELEQKQFIVWKDKSSARGILIIEGWEPLGDSSYLAPSIGPITRGNGLDYWTLY
ncbi:hypothetical protein QPK24_17585 [Paenibacillus polygoni]|uniref:LexA DNA binding domain-containing protein n=1 Tax=Paenibacillus polygoni TaxID=3050112 RepID=A0ABY8WZA7_9BACL|nr:hypothetical protein [Paenibacillus polygoni]WIV18199.1 hypothetical protein QPK24_17585 [Paenibacillus polygoni]